MKCYWITKDRITRGIPEDLNDPKEGVECALITDAEVELAGEERPDLPLEVLQDLPLARLSAICRMRLVPCKPTKSDKYVLAYSPVVAYPDRAGGDETELIYRSPYLFVCIAKEGKTLIRWIHRDGVAVVVGPKGPVESDESLSVEAPKENTFFVRIK